MLTAISSLVTPMEIDDFPSPKSSPMSKARSSPKARTKPKSRKPRHQWHCSDLTIVTKQNGSVKLVNRRFRHDECCDDSMWLFAFPEPPMIGRWLNPYQSMTPWPTHSDVAISGKRLVAATMSLWFLIWMRLWFTLPLKSNLATTLRSLCQTKMVPKRYDFFCEFFVL